MSITTITPVGDNLHQVQRSIWDQASIILNGAQEKWVTTNTQIAAALADLAQFAGGSGDIIMPGRSYLVGIIDGVEIYVDPNMSWTDLRIIGKNVEIAVELGSNTIV